MASLVGSTVNGTLTATTFSGNGNGVTGLTSTNLAASTLNTAQLNANAINRNKLNYAGAVLQTRMIRYDPRPSFSVPTTAGLGTRFTVLRLDITPTYTNSLIIVEWWIHGEPASHDQGFRVARNGALITGTFAGFNTNSGQNNHSYISSDQYDANDSSTPNLSHILFYDFPNTTAATFYEPAANSSDGGTRTYFINRTVSSAGAANNENGVTFGRITEIKQ
jgi:hypothetical protein